MFRECNSLGSKSKLKKKKTFKNFGFYLFWVLILFYGRWAGWESRVETLLGLLRASFSVYMTQTVLSSVIQTQPGRPPKPIFLPHACSKVLLRSIFAYFSHILISKKQNASERIKLLSTFKVYKFFSETKFKNWRGGIGTHTNLL